MPPSPVLDPGLHTSSRKEPKSDSWDGICTLVSLPGQPWSPRQV